MRYEPPRNRSSRTRSGSSGAARTRCTATNTPSSTTPAVRNAQTSQEPQPSVSAVANPKTTPKSPAEAAKLQIGDIIEAIGDRTITDSSSLNRAVAQAPDKTLDVKIIRQGTSLSVPVKFGTLTEGLWVTELPQPKPVKTLADLGLTLANSNNSVVATGVVERSVAWAAGVRPGDTIRKIQFQDVHSIDDVRKAVEDLVAKGLTDGIVLVSNKNGSQWVNISMREW